MAKKPGPKPKPTVVKLFEGNPGKRALNKDEPKVPPTKLRPTTWLSVEAKREWRRVAKLLAKYKMITELDRQLLEAYCTAYARWREAEEEIDLLVVRRKRKNFWIQKQNPYLAVSNMARKQMMECLAELGLTPSGRSRFIQAGKKRGDDDGTDPLGLFG